MKFQNKGAVLVQIAPLFISPSRNQNKERKKERKSVYSSEGVVSRRSPDCFKMRLGVETFSRNFQI